MTSTATAAHTAIHVGESRDFPAGRVVVSVYRKSQTCYRVVVLGHGGLAIDCYTAEFDHLTGGLPIGMSGRAAAWEYMQQLIAENQADVEQPATVAARVTVDQQFTAPTAKVSPAGMRAVASHRDGLVARGRGVTEATLRSLARHHLGDLTYRTVGLRRIVNGLRLNGEGLRLAATIHNTTLAA